MKTSRKVWMELKKLGLMPEKMGDNIKFTYQMVDCIYIQDKDDDEFFSLYVPNVFEVTEENEYEVLKVINECNNSLKVAKLCVNDGQLWVGAELFLQKDATMEDLLHRSIRTMLGALLKFEYEMKGL